MTGLRDSAQSSEAYGPSGGGPLDSRSTQRREPFRIYPIERIDVYRSVLGQLDGLVQSLAPGDRLPPERELVTMLNVSRVVVREALRALESMGKIEIRRNSGSYVLPPRHGFASDLLRTGPIDRLFLEDLVEVRAGVEDRVVMSLMRRANRDLEPATVLLDTIRNENANEYGEPGSFDLRFEAALARATGNALLVELQRAVHELWVTSWAALGIAPGDRAHLDAEHVAILDAIRSGDKVNARERMLDHVDRSIPGANRMEKSE